MADERTRAELDRLERPPHGSGKASDASGRVDRDDIAKRAYLKFEARGQEHGRDQEDWFEAEREVRGSDE